MRKNSVVATALALIGMSACAQIGTTMVQTNEPQASNATTARTLTDIDLSATTTRAEVIATWGAARAFGPAKALEGYGIGTDKELWLSFSTAAPYTLRRALLLEGGLVPKVTLLLDVMKKTKLRRCDQLDFKGDVSEIMVDEAWGPPDNVIGSGLENWRYRLADGGTAFLIFSEGRVIGASGCS